MSSPYEEPHEAIVNAIDRLTGAVEALQEDLRLHTRVVAAVAYSLTDKSNTTILDTLANRLFVVDALMSKLHEERENDRWQTATTRPT